jgi:hypothetical protein
MKCTKKELIKKLFKLSLSFSPSAIVIIIEAMNVIFIGKHREMVGLNSRPRASRGTYLNACCGIKNNNNNDNEET